MLHTASSVPPPDLPKGDDLLVTSAVRLTLGEKSALPSHSLVADRLRQAMPALPAIQMAAELSTGVDTLAHKTGNNVVTGLGVLGVAATVIAAPLKLAGRGSIIAGRIASGLEAAAGAPRVAAEAINDRGPARLRAGAHKLVRELYDQHYWREGQLAPWLWAALLSDPRFSSAPSETTGYVATRFEDSYYLAATHPQKSIVDLHHDLRRPNTEPLAAASKFAEREHEARRERVQKRRPSKVETKRPRGDKLAKLTRSTERYNEYARLGADDLDSVLEEYVELVRDSDSRDDPARHDALLSAWAAVQEKAALPGDEAPRFQWIVHRRMSQLPPLLVLRKDMSSAPTSVVRILVDAMRTGFDPSMRAFTIAPERMKTAVERLDQAAFDWFEQPLTALAQDSKRYPLYNARVRHVVRQAFELDRLLLAKSGSPELDAGRARRLSNEIRAMSKLDRRALPVRLERLIDWAEGHKPEEVPWLRRQLGRVNK